MVLTKQNIIIGFIFQKLLPISMMDEITPRLSVKNYSLLIANMLNRNITKRVLASSLFDKEMQMPNLVPLPRLVSKLSQSDPSGFPLHQKLLLAILSTSLLLHFIFQQKQVQNTRRYTGRFGSDPRERPHRSGCYGYSLGCFHNKSQYCIIKK